MRIDGIDAYNANLAHSVDGAGPWPGLTVTRSYDPATGTFTVTENDTLSQCSAHCTPLNVTPVSVHRTMKLTHEGLVFEMTDVWSTTGPATSVDLLSEQQFRGRLDSHNVGITGFAFPGETAFTAHRQGDVVPIAVPGGPGTILYQLDTTQPDGPDNPRASITLLPVPDLAFFFGSHGDKFLLHYAFTIPAGGSYTIRTIGAHENTPDALAPLTSESEDRLQGPSVAITAPADWATVRRRECR